MKKIKNRYEFANNMRFEKFQSDDLLALCERVIFDELDDKRIDTTSLGFFIEALQHYEKMFSQAEETEEDFIFTFENEEQLFEIAELLFNTEDKKE